MMSGKKGLIAEFVATLISVRNSPQGHYLRSRLTSAFCGSLLISAIPHERLPLRLRITAAERRSVLCHRKHNLVLCCS